MTFWIYQGCHYLLDVKFKDFSMTFQAIFKQTQDLFYQLEISVQQNTYYNIFSPIPGLSRIFKGRATLIYSELIWYF